MALPPNKPLVGGESCILKKHLIHLTCETSQLSLAYLKRAHNTYMSLRLGTKPILPQVVENLIQFIEYYTESKQQNSCTGPHTTKRSKSGKSNHCVGDHLFTTNARVLKDKREQALSSSCFSFTHFFFLSVAFFSWKSLEELPQPLKLSCTYDRASWSPLRKGACQPRPHTHTSAPFQFTLYHLLLPLEQTLPHPRVKLISKRQTPTRSLL